MAYNYDDYNYDFPDDPVAGAGNGTAVGNDTCLNGTAVGNDTCLNGTTTPAYEGNEGYEGYGDDDFVYEEFIYPGFAFERPIYLVIWECLVIWTLLFNIIVVMILLRKKLRNTTNIILVFIAVSDSMTGLVTLPTYIYVYDHFVPGQTTEQSGSYDYYSAETDNTSNTSASNTSASDSSAYYNMYHDAETGESMSVHTQSDYYILTKAWCQAFMISKFFVSKAFHTISIWLTLFLGIQRYISVRYPFKAQQLFTTRKTLLAVLLIYVITPWMHVYHLLDEKARDSDGMCEWTLQPNCGAGCAYLWIAFLFMHFIPCLLLVVFTALMVSRLYRSAAAAKGSMNRERAAARNGANRRITIVVSTIVIVFLIPEIPYGFFLLYSVLRRHANLDILTLESNRAFHAVYELLLVTTFHANFWIYTGLNRRFRFELRTTFSCVLGPMYRAIGARFRHSFRSTSFSRTSTRTTGGRTTQSDVHMNTVAVEMKPLRTASHDT